MQTKKTPKKKDEMEDLKCFIKKKKAENKVLKKIIVKLNTNENKSINK